MPYRSDSANKANLPTHRSTRHSSKPLNSNPVGRHWLFGGLANPGVCLEYYDFKSPLDLDWVNSSTPGCLELCLNLTGSWSLQINSNSLSLAPLTAGYYIQENKNRHPARLASGPHRFVLITLSREFAYDYLQFADGALCPLVEKFVSQTGDCSGFSRQFRLRADQERLIAQLQHPPVSQAARPLWYRGKILQLMAEYFFDRPEGDELFCDRQKRVARERADRVCAFLCTRLANPPSLEEIGRHVGCSPFHLSRVFSQETGTTISQYLRKIRLERAAELLREGRCNVTEAALEVGYSSLSHFTVAFREAFGCCPGLYPLSTRTPA